MIRLERDRTPTAVPAPFRGHDRNTRELKLLKDRRAWLQAGTAAKFELNSNLWKPAKAQLALESGDKCAYCEASAKTVCHCDVEHVRPKAIYWWLALCYDNYVLACQLCNQSFKSDKYPIKGNQLVAPPLAATSSDAALQTLVGTFAPDPIDDSETIKRTAYVAAFKKEKPALMDPYRENPEEYFLWEPDADQKEVAITPRAKKGHKKWRAEQSIETLGLNREELRRVRWQAYRPIAVHCRTYKSGRLDDDPALKADTKAVLIEAMDTRQFFSGLFRWTILEEFALTL